MSVWFWISAEPSSSVSRISIFNISTIERNNKKHLEISRCSIWLNWRLGSATERVCLGLRHACETSWARTDRQTTMREHTYDCLPLLCATSVTPQRLHATYMISVIMNKLRAYLVYFKWRNKLKHRDGSLFYCWQSAPIKLSQVMRKVGSEFGEREKDSRLSASPESVTMTDTIRLPMRMTSRETCARLHRAWPRKSPTPTHASTASTRPPTNSRAVSQILARCLPRQRHGRVARHLREFARWWKELLSLQEMWIDNFSRSN